MTVCLRRYDVLDDTIFDSVTSENPCSKLTVVLSIHLLFDNTFIEYISLLHKHKNTYTHGRTHARTHARTCMQALNAPTSRHMHQLIKARPSTRTYERKNTHKQHTRTNKYPRSHIRTYTRTHAPTYAGMGGHTQTPTHLLTPVHKYTHEHTLVYAYAYEYHTR